MGRRGTADGVPARAALRELTAEEFEQVVQMLAEGYSTRRGRRCAYLHYDAVNRRAARAPRRAS